MKIRTYLLATVLTLFTGATIRATIYECRAYNGTNFFSNNYCSQSNGIGVLNHSVPDNMSFQDQVRIVEEAKARERFKAQSEENRRAQLAAEYTSDVAQCRQIDEAIAIKDSELRQPHSGQWGDYLTAERKKLMDQRFALRC